MRDWTTAEKFLRDKHVYTKENIYNIFREGFSKSPDFKEFSHRTLDYCAEDLVKNFENKHGPAPWVQLSYPEDLGEIGNIISVSWFLKDPLKYVTECELKGENND